MIHIYILIHPVSQIVFYVGATMNPKERLSSHCNLTGYCGSYKDRVIIDLLDNDLKPEMEVVDSVSYDKAAFFEDFYLDLFRSYGYYLPQRRSTYKGDLLSKYQKYFLTNSRPQIDLKKFNAAKRAKRKEVMRLYPERYENNGTLKRDEYGFYV